MALFQFPVVTISTTGLASEAKQDTIISNQGTSLVNEATMISNQQELIDLTRLTVVDQLDTQVLDTSSTNIPGSASLPLEVVASLAATVQQVQSVEDIGEYIGLYTGAASSEVLKAILPLGGGEVRLEIPAGTRVSLRSMTASAISVGNIAINFLG